MTAEDAKTEAEFDFNSEDCNGFYYTSEKQLKKMDDALIVARITEKYPDFVQMNGENVLKQAFAAVARDTRLLRGISAELDISIQDIFAVIYRNFTFLFNGAFTAKLRKIVAGRAYAKDGTAANGRKVAGSARGKARDAKGAGRKA